ncbi:hypothetical protein PPERSA_13137 [Pseudocohnilembus persalinus]|uniref:Uncharacterized protein n=1 Tax=Pseudocohnilembus persalinus TaxID=266149 RepID=A0A0V0QWP5_PSEPJ|nr:hypothetical protein PPERSA_13137 [Pseudocohnilembus persalinus]|eukprot:KRX06658.1 hypothetical protein PPERSA_13137 [Pseudocohnilembus persalinus]
MLKLFIQKQIYFIYILDLAVERLHDILKESDENLPEVSPKQIYKQVLNRERRKVYREVYAQIMKNLDAPKDDKKLKEKKEYLETDQVAIVEKMNRIKIEFLRIKSENLFVDIASGKLNEKVVKDTPVTFKNMDMYIEVEKFTLMVNELFQDIQSNLNSMISLKDSERQYFRESFGKVLNNTVLALVNEEVSLSKYGTNKSIPELIASQFRGLRDLIHPHELEKAFQEENQNTLVQEEVGTTNKFMRDVDIYNQRQQLENKKRHFMMQNKLKQDQMKYAQAVAALEKEKKFITKHKIDFPQRDNYMGGNDNRVSENNKKEIEELEEELKGANKNKKLDEDYNQMSNYGKSVYDDIMNERQPGFAKEKYENEAKNQYNEQMKTYDNQRQNQMESQRNEREEREKRRQELLEQKKQEYRKKEQEREDAIRQQREQSIQEQEELRRKREQEDFERKEKIRLQREEVDRQRKQRQEEQDRIRKEQIEKENREREERQKRLEEERNKREAEDKERREKQEQERQKREQEEKERREKQEQERRERLEREKHDREAREQQDRERKEKERQEREKREKEDRERREKERKEREEREKQERENRERERKEKEEREKFEREQREKERQLQQQQKEQREKEEREKREQERQLQQQQKEQREREEREKREQEKREQEAKEQREREKREQEEKERREKEQREKEEAERLEKELLQKENQAKAQQKGKSSGFNYDEVDLDNDDDDDDYKFDGDSLSLGEDILNDDKKRKSSNKKSDYQSNDYDGYEDDFEIEEDLPDISTNKKNFNSNKTNGGGISALDEIHSEIDEDKYSSQHSQIDIVEQSGNTMKSSYAYFDEDFDMLKATNDYIARTKWGKQNKVQLQGLDNIDSVIQLFEEFIQLGTAFFFDYEHSLNLFQLLQIQDEKEQDETFDEYLSILRGYYNQFTGKMDFESEDMKLYFPFVFNEDNVFNILLIEKNSNKKCVNIFFYDELDQDPQRLEEFQYFVNMFQQLFRCYDEIEGEMDPWEVKSVKISDQTVNYLLENYQEMPYVTYQLLIFSLIYEKNQDKALVP